MHLPCQTQSAWQKGNDDSVLEKKAPRLPHTSPEDSGYKMGNLHIE
jgi:hypothetical protein